MATYLAQKLPQDDEETHQVPCITGKDPLRVTTTHILGCCAHRGSDDFACCVHQQLSKPLKHLLYDLRVRFLQVCDAEVDANVRDASCDLSI
jgi:hypothetical protein